MRPLAVRVDDRGPGHVSAGRDVRDQASIHQAAEVALGGAGEDFQPTGGVLGRPFRLGHRKEVQNGQDAAGGRQGAGFSWLVLERSRLWGLNSQ